MLMLDTHVLVWLGEANETLSQESRGTINRANMVEGLGVSAVTFWEVGMLDAKSRISLSAPVDLWRRHFLETVGIREVPLSGDIAIEATRLPGMFHADPADRLIVATARVFNWSLATRDQSILDYGRQGHVRTIAV